MIAVKSLSLADGVQPLEPGGSLCIRTRRTGVVAPLVAFVLPLLFVFITLAVDYGTISVAKQQLQNAADAAAEASVNAYFEDRELGDQAAQEVITNNILLGDTIDFDIRRSVDYGTWDANTRQFSPLERTGQPNASDDYSGSSIPIGATAVRVTLARTPENGNGLNLFFAPIFGTDHATVVAQGIASVSPT